MSWTQERVAVLEKMWTDGKSAAEIAKALGEGVTRNAVIGKAHRMGLSGRPSPIKKSKTSKKAAPSKAEVKTPKSQIKTKKEKPEAKDALPKNIKPIPAAPVKKKKEMPTGEGLSILDLTDRICKWPFGDPQDADFNFCGEAVHPGKPYCLDHCAEAYQTLARKKKARKNKLKLTTAEKMKEASDALDEDEDEEDLEDIENLDVDALENSDDIDDDDDDNIDVA